MIFDDFLLSFMKYGIPQKEVLSLRLGSKKYLLLPKSDLIIHGDWTMGAGVYSNISIQMLIFLLFR